MSPLQITVVILLCTIAAFISGKIRFSVISTGIILALILTKVSTPAEALSGFVNKNVVMFVAMFVIGAGLTRTSILDRTQSIVISYKEKPKTLILIACVVAGLLAVLTSATAAGAIMMPLLIGIANEIGTSRSRLLYPAMCVANVGAGMTFLGQGASNLAFSDIMMKAGGTVPFGIWDFTIARLPVMVIALVYMSFIGWKLLPEIPNESFEDNIKLKKTQALSPAKEKIAIIIIIATIVSMLFSKRLGIDMFILASFGAVALVIFGVLTENEALSSIHMPTVFLFAGVLPLSNAIKVTGAGDLVAEKLILMLGNTSSPYIIMAVFFLVPLVMTQVMSNIATIMIFIPLVSVAGVKIGVDPRALVMGVLIAGCTSILTPMASPPQALIMGPGGYKLIDYFKAGLPLVVIVAIFSILFLPILYPFY